MHLSKLEDLEPFTTLDGSTIREIAGPAWTPARNQSLAEATVPVGGRTVAHYHRVTEELYFFTAGRGRMLSTSSMMIPPIRNARPITPKLAYSTRFTNVESNAPAMSAGTVPTMIISAK